MLEKITAEELVGKGVIGMDDSPKLTAEEMQKKFEETAREVIVPKFNRLIEALTGESGAGEVGAADPVTGENVTVQKALESLLKATVHTVVQELTAEQRQTARDNIRALSWETDALEPGQQAQARANIGAASTMDTYALEQNKAPKEHISQTPMYGKGSGMAYGHVLIKDTPDETLDVSKGAAATPKALYNAMQSRVSVEAQELTSEQRNTARNNICALSWETDGLEPGQQARARANIGAASTMDTYGTVKYTEQKLTGEEKAQAVENIQAVSYRPGQNLGADGRTAARQNIDAAKKNHASMTTDYGVADSLNFGHVRLHTAVSDKDAPGTAVTPRAVYDAINRMAVTLGEQELTEEQKAQARENIGAAAVGEGGGEVGDITWDDISVTYGDTLTWDGNTTGLPNAMGMVFKVSEAVPTVEDLQKGFSVRTNLGDSMEFPAGDTEEIAVDGIIAMNIFFVVPPEMAGVESEAIGLAFPEAGTYFTVMDGIYLTELRINGYNGFGKKEKVPQDRLPLDEIGSVANWDAAEGEPGYIINKPFGNELVEILPETEVTPADDNGTIGAMLDYSLFANAGEQLVITFDGVKYTCNKFEPMGGAMAYGNGKFVGSDDTGEPFCLLLMESCSVACLYTQDTNSHTVSVGNIAAKPIDSEFLPESGVTAGTYGAYVHETYYVPIFTVDETGRVTAARQTVIYSVENNMGSGLMPYAAYNYAVKSGHFGKHSNTITVGETKSFALNNCTIDYAYVSGVGNVNYPIIYGALIYTFTPNSPTEKRWVHIDPKYLEYFASGDSMSGYVSTVYVTFPKEYEEYYSTGDSTKIVILYEKVYGSSSSVM